MVFTFVFKHTQMATTEPTFIVLATGHVLYFNIGQVVYLKTDKDQLERIVTGVFLSPNKQVTYYLSFLGNETKHYDFEIDAEKDIIKATSN